MVIKMIAQKYDSESFWKRVGRSRYWELYLFISLSMPFVIIWILGVLVW